MLEIVFDEKGGNEFLGQKCPDVILPFVEDNDFSSFRAVAKEIIEKNSEQRVIIVKAEPRAEVINLWALAFNVESYDEQTCLENVVFKVCDCRQAIEDYKPFAALANSIRYARDLLQLDKNEQWADIKRLGYLGLKVTEDYIHNQLDIYWPGEEPCKEFAAVDELSGLVLVGMMKAWAINKEKFAAHGVLGAPGNTSTELLSVPKTEDEMIEKIIKYVRMNKHGN